MDLSQFQQPQFLKTLEGFCLMGTGLVAGITTYITLIEVPARANKSPAYQLENYHELFPRAAFLMKNFGAFLTVVTIATAVLTEKKRWWIPVAFVGGLGPFTAVFIQPTNSTLMAAQDGTKVKGELESWGQLHSVRTVMTLFGFAGATAAVLDV
eukprot:m.221038 g.221038  ORF g.221038 m.221038 type:complete len:154 (+) comp15606_c0_seq6:5424-5885(+)